MHHDASALEVGDFGSLIREARRADGLTQAQLAGRLGITQPAVARLEAAGDSLTLGTLRRALTALGRRLELRADADSPDVDETLLAGQLRLSPAERVTRFESTYAGMRELALAGERARGVG